MLYEWRDLLDYWGLAAASAAAAAAWVGRGSLAKLGKPSYDELVREWERLHDCVAHWKYPDGTLVPQHKRQRMFGQMRRLSRRIRNHPDHSSASPDDARGAH